MAGFFSRGARAKKEMEEAAAESELKLISHADLRRRVQLLDSFENAGLGWFWATDGQGRLIYLSENAIEKLGDEGASLMGKQLTEVFEPETDESLDQQVQRPLPFLLGARNSISQLVVKVIAGNRVQWWEIAGKPQFDAKREFVGYRGSAKDVTATFQSSKDAERLSQFDSLTGLANRHRMTKRLTSILTAFRNSKRSCAPRKELSENEEEEEYDGEDHTERHS